MIIDNQSKLDFDSVLPDGQTVPGSVDSNIVQTEVLTDAFAKVKSSATTFVKEGGTLSQLITLTNNSGANLTNLFFNDTLGDGADHVAGSVFVNNVSYPAYDVVAGFPLPNLAPGQNHTVSYSVIADNPKTKDTVDNFATIKYDVNDPVSGPRTISENTNLISFAVISTRLDVEKSVDKAYAIKGDTLTYTSKITNTGSQKATNVVFSDPLDSSITFVPNSVTIDGVSYPAYNPNSTFPLGDLDSGESHTVVFKATVN